MNKLASIALFLLGSLALNAQNAKEIYSRVAINLEGKSLSELAALGIDAEHGIHAGGKWIVIEISSGELQKVHKAGFKTRIYIEDLQKDYLARLNSATDRGNSCSSPSITPYPVPENYTYGSMGGYHTLEEMMAVLDDMRAKFPNLISARADVSDTISTWEGRKLQYVRLSANPDVDEDEPEVLYTGLHHAREPNSASHLLFFMWYLLEHYNVDPEIKYLLDHEELYFIPCLNPDGYVYNQTTDPQGGGFWRKNRRDNGLGSYGVDLNRNYGYFWGNDNSGSSPQPDAETYRGPGPFSEPESRSVRDFGRAHHFVLALNCHTYGNLFIYPWAYNNLLADTSFAILARVFTRENNYHAGTSIQTVGYNVNGSSDDWLYSEGGTLSYTPEIGPQFWPSPSEIEGLNRANMWQDLSTAYAALRFATWEDKSPQFFSTFSPDISVQLTRLGFQDGPFTLSVTPLTPNIVNINTDHYTIDIQQFESQTVDFGLTLSPTIQVGEPFTLLLKYSNGFFEKTDTLHKFYGGKTVAIISENGNNLNQWSGDWGVTTESFVSAPSSITDSPGGNYSSVEYKEIKYNGAPIQLPLNAHPQLRFWAKWQIEKGYDYAQVRATGFTEEALCGRFTSSGTGSGAQPQGEPVFDGESTGWVEECMDLSDFAGQSIDLSFIFASDNGLELDGFYFDDLKVEYVDPTLLETVSIPLDRFSLRQNEPNPGADYTMIRWENNQAFKGNAQLVCRNSLGQIVANYTVNPQTQQSLRIDTGAWPSGMYTYQMLASEGQSAAVKMTVVH